MDLTALFAWSFLAATILPLGSEPALAAVVIRRGVLALPVVVATTGNYLGACTTYLLARAAAIAFERRAAAAEQAGQDDASRSEPAVQDPGQSPARRSARRMERAAAIVRRYGAPALLLSWVPLIGDAIVAAAGAARMPFVPFSAWTIVGKLARYLALAAIVQSAT